MGERIAGVAYLKVDGAQYPLKGGFTVSPSDTEREGIAGQDYVHGYKEMPRVPFIEGDVSTVPELSIEDINAVTNATVTAELANGRVYVLSGAWCTNATEIDTEEGQFTVRFEGLRCRELGRQG